MNIVRWEPFREMEDFLRQSPLFSNSLRRNRNESMSEWRPLADISETDQEYIIKAELPEVKKEDVQITLSDGVMTITGERKKEKEHKEANELRVESFYGVFSRSFALPDNIDPKNIRAESKDGVLRVHVPKTEASRNEPMKIEIH